MVTAREENEKKRINLDTALTGQNISSVQKVRLILSLSLPAILAQLTSIAMQYIDADGHRTADVFIEGIQIQAAVMGAEAGSPFVKEVLDWYQDKHFVKPDGSLRTDVLSPYIYARVAEKKGFVYKDIDQQLPGRIHIYPSETFAGNKHEVTDNSYAIHMCAHSWHLTPWEKIRRLLGLSKKHVRVEN